MHLGLLVLMDALVCQVREESVDLLVLLEHLEREVNLEHLLNVVSVVLLVLLVQME